MSWFWFAYLSRLLASFPPQTVPFMYIFFQRVHIFFFFFSLEKNLSLQIFLIGILFSGLLRVWQIIEIPQEALFIPSRTVGSHCRYSCSLQIPYCMDKSCKYDYLLCIYICSLSHVVFKIPLLQKYRMYSYFSLF